MGRQPCHLLSDSLKVILLAGRDPRGWIYSLQHWPEPRLAHPPFKAGGRGQGFSSCFLPKDSVGVTVQAEVTHPSSCLSAHPYTYF